jgi:hypothetical protein
MIGYALKNKPFRRVAAERPGNSAWGFSPRFVAIDTGTLEGCGFDPDHPCRGGYSVFQNRPDEFCKRL